MARVRLVSPQEAGEDVATIFRYAREGFSQLTGRDTETMIEPFQVYAHIPELLQGMVAMAGASGALDRLPRRYERLATLRAATMTHCEYCIDLNSQISRRSGLSDEELLALANYRTSDLFDDVDKLVLDYATALSRTPVEVPDELFDALRQHFNEAQLVELTHVIAVENMYGRFNLGLGIGAAGLSEGMVCAIPAAV